MPPVPTPSFDVVNQCASPVLFLQVLGGDLAGVVEEADEGSKFKKGDQVAALTPGFYNETQDGGSHPTCLIRQQSCRL
jgi:NADPH:quinone reductase-like Zn-dependent oxidoreductase